MIQYQINKFKNVIYPIIIICSIKINDLFNLGLYSLFMFPLIFNFNSELFVFLLTQSLLCNLAGFVNYLYRVYMLSGDSIGIVTGPSF